MDVRLDQPVTVADSYGHHGVHCDPMGGQMARDGNFKDNRVQPLQKQMCFTSRRLNFTKCYLSGYFLAL